MDDLVKRLRDVQDNWPLRDIELEAADRIEALEAALRQIVDLPATREDEAEMIARTALGEKKDG